MLLKPSIQLRVQHLLWAQRSFRDKGSKDVGVEYSYIRANPSPTGFPSFSINGGSGSFAYNPRSWYGLEAEFSGYHIGNIRGAIDSANLFTYMFGPQLYFHHFNRFTPFAQELLGVAQRRHLRLRRSAQFLRDGARGGVDVPFRGHLSLRFGPVDYLMTNFPEPSTVLFPAGGASRKLQNNLRVSGGVRWRF